MSALSSLFILSDRRYPHPPSFLSASTMVIVIYNSIPSHLSLLLSTYLRLSPSFGYTQTMASANEPGLAPPPGVTPDFTSPYTLQPYQALTAVACIILTTVMVAARLYTVSNVPSQSFPIPYQIISLTGVCRSSTLSRL